jgi:hypothetical protein
VTNRQVYWRHSRPALVLAAITTAFALASYYTRPRIQSVYRSYIENQLQASFNEGGERQLRRSELAVRRLVQSNVRSSSVNLLAAEVDAKAIDFHRARAQRFTTNSKSREDLADLESIRVLSKSLFESMERVAQTSGTDGDLAKIWILNSKVATGPLGSGNWDVFWNEILNQVSINDANGMVLETRLFIENEKLYQLATQSIAMGILKSSFDSGGNTASNARWESWKDKPLILESCLSDPRYYALSLEQTACTDRLLASARARSRFKELLEEIGGSSSLWREQSEIERIDAAFVSLIVLDSVDEAIAFAMNQLETAHRLDSENLRGVFIQSLLRAIGRLCHCGAIESRDDSYRASRLLHGLLVLGSKYPVVQGLFERILLREPSDSIALRIESAVQGDSSLKNAIDWFRNRVLNHSGVRSEYDGESDSLLSSVDDSLAQSMVVLVGYLIREKRVDAVDATFAIREMVNHWPAIGELRFALAMVSLEAGMNEEAISVLSELHDRIPDNIQIQNLLLKAYEQALGSK